jgi:cell division septum initiation protein DivIVA
MKTADRLKKIEAASMPALRLAAVKSFSEAEGETEGDFLASVLCGLAERGATFPVCDELRAMRERENARMAALTEAELNALPTLECSREWSDGYLCAVFLWDAFRVMPTEWRLPGAEARLLGEIADEADEFTGKTQSEIRAQLNRELDRMKKEINERENPT